MQDLATAAAISAGVLVLAWATILLTRRKAEPDSFLRIVSERTKILLVVLPAVYLGARAFGLPRDLHRLLKAGAALSLIAQTAFWLSAVIEFWARRYRRTRTEGDPGAAMTVNIFRVAAVVTVWIVAALVAIEFLGFNAATLVAGLGIGGVAVALALQNILGDLFASLSIVVDKPFVIGDTIGVDQHTGTVEHIGLKTTRVRANTGEELIFSNGDLLKSRIHNFKRLRERRATLRMSLAPETPAPKLERVPVILRGAVEKQQHAAFDRAHVVGMGAIGYETEVVFTVASDDFSLFADARQAVITDLVRALDAEGIKIAWQPHTVC